MIPIIDGPWGGSSCKCRLPVIRFYHPDGVWVPTQTIESYEYRRGAYFHIRSEPIAKQPEPTP